MPSSQAVLLATRYILAIFATICLGLTTSQPRAQEVYTYSDFNQRHYPGTRYQALDTVRVFEKPDPESPIVYDVPRGRMLYAKPTTVDGWLQITGAGTRQYPDPYQGVRSMEFKDGKFEGSDGEDRDLYYPQIGFVEARLVIDIDHGAAKPAPIVATGTVPYDSPWTALGISDGRSFILEQGAYPVGAIGRLIRDDGQGRVGLCSGFLLGNQTTFVTAQHCIGNARQWFVAFPDSRVRGQVTKAKLYAASPPQRLGKGDWAVFTLQTAPAHKPEPLKLADLNDIKGQTNLYLADIGFPGDLGAISAHQYQYRPPVLSQCSKPTNTIRYIPGATGFQFSFPSCLGWFGNSGGPTFVWVESIKEWRVLGIVSTGGVNSDLMVGGGRSLFGKFPTAGLRSIEKIANSELGRLKLPPIKITKTTDEESIHSVPGLAAVVEFAKQNDAWTVGSGDSTMSSELEDALLRLDAIQHHMNIAELSKDPKLISIGIDEPNKPLLLADGPFWDNLRQQRRVCIEYCKQVHLNREMQSKFSYGDIISRSFEEYPTTLSFKAKFAEEEFINIIVGGDLYFIRPSTRSVVGVIRSFLGFQSGTFSQTTIRFLQADCMPDYNDKIPDKTSVDPTESLRASNFGAPTPARVPGATTIGAITLCRMIRDSSSAPLVISALGNSVRIPGAVVMPNAASGGTFDDATQAALNARSRACSMVRLTDQL